MRSASRFDLISRLLGTRVAPARTHNRQALRRPLSLVVLCKYDETEFLAEVLDIGQNGIRVRMTQSVSAGSILGVRCTEDDTPRQTIHMGVVWCAPRPGGMEAGLQYVTAGRKLEESWMGHLMRRHKLAGEAGKERRCHGRVAARVSTRASLPGSGEQICGTVLEWNHGGASLEAPFETGAGTAVELQIGESNRSGQVVHSRLSPNGAMWVWGIRFDAASAASAARVG